MRCVFGEKKKRRKNAIRVEVYSGYFCNEMSRIVIEKSIRLATFAYGASVSINYSYTILFSVFRSSIL